LRRIRPSSQLRETSRLLMKPSNSTKWMDPQEDTACCERKSCSRAKKKCFKDFHLRAKARIWPWLSCMCRIRSTAVHPTSPQLFPSCHSGCQLWNTPVNFRNPSTFEGEGGEGGLTAPREASSTSNGSHPESRKLSESLVFGV